MFFVFLNNVFIIFESYVNDVTVDCKFYLKNSVTILIKFSVLSFGKRENPYASSHVLKNSITGLVSSHYRSSTFECDRRYLKNGTYDFQSYVQFWCRRTTPFGRITISWKIDQLIIFESIRGQIISIVMKKLKND